VSVSEVVLLTGLVIVCYITGTLFEVEQKKEMIRYLRSVQCPDGGWGLLVELFTNSTSAVVLFVFCS